MPSQDPIQVGSILFIGGPYDGLRLPDNGHEIIKVPHQLDPIHTEFRDAGTDSLKNTIYRRQLLRGGARLFSVYVEESLSPDQYMELLLEGYRK